MEGSMDIARRSYLDARKNINEKNLKFKKVVKQLSNK